ncbi:MAG: VOC family protein [Bdellovibrionota bacterium]
MKYLHTMIRVTDLSKSLKFYCEGLGFQKVSQSDYPDRKFTLVFLRAPSDGNDGPMIELTHNWDTDHYVRGDAYGHVAYAVESIEEIKTRLQSHGFDLSWGPGKTPNGKRAMAFVDDPDGFEIELLQG